MVQVLVVEDNQAFADALAVMLSLDGYDVSVALTAEEGIRIGLACRPDIVVADWMLKGRLHGGQVCQQIRAACPAVRSIIITGHLNRVPEVMQWSDEVDTILEKPFHREELREAIDRAMDALGSTT